MRDLMKTTIHPVGFGSPPGDDEPG